MTAWCKSRRSQPLRFQLERLEQRITLGGLLRALMALCLGNDGDSDAIDDIAPPPIS